MNKHIQKVIAAAIVVAMMVSTAGCSKFVAPGDVSSEVSSETTAVSTTTTTTTTTAATTTTTTTATTTSAATSATATTTKKKTTATTKAAPESLNGQEVCDYALQYLGVPYVYGGSNLSSGVDCSGFTLAVYRHFGISLPHRAAAQANYGTKVSAQEALPGDLCTTVYDDGTGYYSGHAAIYLGNGQVVNAIPGEGVIISDICELRGEYTYHRLFKNTYGQ